MQPRDNQLSDKSAEHHSVDEELWKQCYIILNTLVNVSLKWVNNNAEYLYKTSPVIISAYSSLIKVRLTKLLNEYKLWHLAINAECSNMTENS